jgi:hypothetical protein
MNGNIIKLIYLILNKYMHSYESGQLSGMALGYGLYDREVRAPVGAGNFLLTTASRPALGPTQTPIECVPRGGGGAFPRGKSGRGVKITIHLQLAPRLRMRGARPPLSVLHGVVIS